MNWNMKNIIFDATKNREINSWGKSEQIYNCAEVGYVKEQDRFCIRIDKKMSGKVIRYKMAQFLRRTADCLYPVGELGVM